MKKIFSALLLFISATAIAQSTDRAVLKLSLSDRSPLSVNVDGRYIDRQTTSLTLDGLRPGRHRVEVYSTDGSRWRPVRIYTGTLGLEPGTLNIALVDVYRRSLRMRTRPMDERGEDAPVDRNDDRRRDNDEGGNRDGDHNDDRNDHAGNNNGDDIYGNSDKDNRRTDEEDKGTGYGSFPNGREHDTGRNGTAKTFTQRDTKALRSLVSRRVTDTEKESLLKSVLQNSTVSIGQVREMCGWLLFESTRLDFAKWAYSHTADRRNYRKLEDIFTLSASKKAFNKAIRAR